MVMRRQYRICNAMVAGGPLLAAIGVGTILWSVFVLGSLFRNVSGHFEGEYRDGSDYAALYQEAVKANQAFSVAHRAQVSLIGLALAVGAVLVIVWALDRRSLAEKLAAAQQNGSGSVSSG
jgi:hypothetical protein